MFEHQEEFKIADKYLAEMLEADRDGNYLAFIKRFETVDPDEFNESIFLNDVDLMREELGLYKERVYLGSLKGISENSKQRSLRFVWRGIYDKNEALIVLGIHQKDGTWYVNENHVS